LLIYSSKNKNLIENNTINEKLYRRRFMSVTVLQKIALIVTIIGAINWGLIGLFDFDLVAWLFGGETSLLSRTIYTLVGITGLINIGLLVAPTED
jgi:uncharacterized protein